MLMRYEWGLAVGHTYAYGDAKSANQGILRSRGSLPNDTATPLERRASTAQDPAVHASGTGDTEGSGIGPGEEGRAQDGMSDVQLEEETEDEDEDEDEDETDSDDDLKSIHDPEYDSEVEKELTLFGWED